MHCYYLDRPLSDEEVGDVEDAGNVRVEQVRIPHVLPTTDGTPEILAKQRTAYDEIAKKALTRAGIARDLDRRVMLVIPLDVVWYAAFTEAVFLLTGCYPLLVQTAENRAAFDNPGYLRILDMHGLMGFKVDD